MSERVKSDNEKGYYILDAINSAIDSRKKISFQYVDYDVTGKQFLKHDGKPYIVSPYELILKLKPLILNILPHGLKCA